MSEPLNPISSEVIEAFARRHQPRLPLTGGLRMSGERLLERSVNRLSECVRELAERVVRLEEKVARGG